MIKISWLGYLCNNRKHRMAGNIDGPKRLAILLQNKQDKWWWNINMWVRLRQEDDALMLAVCYLPPESSSRGQNVEKTLQPLSEQVAKIS